MKNDSLRVFFYPDVPQIEREPFEAVIDSFKEKTTVSVVDVNDNHRNGVSEIPENTVWIVARHWREAIFFLGAHRFKKGRVFVSVLDLDSPRKSVYHVLAKNLFGSLPRNCTLLVHSPINYRFFGEMEKFKEHQLHYLPLPAVMKKDFSLVKKAASDVFTVGTYTTFKSEAQLNFIATIAHYILSRESKLHFRVLGFGPLYQHLIDLGNELELGSRFCVTECFSEDPVMALDAFIYCPLRNDHFIPLYASAKLGLPTISTEMSGIDELIQDGKTGFIVPVNETKQMAELILRISTSPVAAEPMGKKFQDHVLRKFALDSLFPLFLETITGQKLSQGEIERAA